MKGIKAYIQVCDRASPIYFKSRLVPYALREAVEAELNKLEENRVIIKVEQSDWASPVVVVPKVDGSVRLCGNYKVTINQVSSILSQQHSTCTLPWPDPRCSQSSI